MAYQFNPPPGWPTPPPGWSPPEGWAPESNWPAPPEGWQFWVEENEPPAAAAPFDAQPPSTQQFPAQPFPGAQAPTQQFPSQPAPAASYSAAPAPYSAEPSALPYATGAAPSYSPGGYAPQGPGGFGPGGPGGPDGKKPMAKGLLFSIIGVAALVVGGGIFFLIQARGGGGDDSADPTPSPSTSVASPTDDPTTPDPTDDPSDDPTTADPTDDPTTADPTTPPPASGGAPEGASVIAPGGGFDATNFSGDIEARVTLQEIQWDPQCDSDLFPPDGQYVALKFEVATTDAVDPTIGFMLQGLYWTAFGPQGEVPDFSIFGGLFCTVEGELSTTVLPNTTESGWIVFDVPSDAQWLVYNNYFSSDSGYAIALR